MTAEVGRIIDERYVVEAELGRGGMGIVVRVRHRITNARHALKMLHRELQIDESLEHRFISEARASSAIGHPGIVTVFDGGRTPQGELYLVMELLEGRTLRRAMTNAIPPEISRRIVLDLLDALGAAHARGMVHRDLKPDNVFLCNPHGQVKLLDFGIAKVAETASRAGGITAAGALLGTLQYMAPEQLMDASAVDHRADLWAVGVIVYELISGKLPFRGASAHEIMVSLATEEPTPIRAYVAVDPQVEAFISRALARDRERRFTSAHEMAAAVAVLFGQPSAPSTVSAQAAGGYTVATGAGYTVATGASVPNHGFTVATGASVPNHGFAVATASVPNHGYADASNVVALTPSAPAVPVGYAPTMPASVMPAQPTYVPTPQRKPWLGIAIALAAVAAVAIVIAVLARGTSPAGVDAAVVASDAPADATVVVDLEKLKIPDADEDVCPARCGAIESCGYPVADCERLCRTSPLFHECIATSDCFDVSRCYVGMGCPKRPSGTASCRKTLECMTKCSGAECQCGCFGNAAPQHALLIGRFGFCVYGCQQSGGNLEACVKSKCMGVVKTCMQR